MLEIEPGDLLSALSARHQEWRNSPPSGSQLAAWGEEISLLRDAFRTSGLEAVLDSCSVVFEYELPLEGGRRPDVVVLAGSSIIVCEFKQTARVTQAAVDQTEAYARDLIEYHSGSRGRAVTPVLVLTRALALNADFDPVALVDREGLGHLFLQFESSGQIDLQGWLQSAYEPLPTLVTAARRIFTHEELPHVRAALSHDIPQVLAKIGRIVADAEAKRERHLVLLSGVPGSGKTLVGLRLVYEQLTGSTQRTIFLSGNGPLIQVLRDALKSGIFVKDLHKFIKEYGIDHKAPTQQVIVFDEAQRAWDSGFMSYKKQVSRSEPDFLLDIGDRTPNWCVLVGLVGEGQEIFSGEEGGLEQWATAVRESEGAHWTVHGSTEAAGYFAECDYQADDSLRLRIDLRSRRADLLHEWVQLLLEGSLQLASQVAPKIAGPSGLYPLYVTRSLEDARAYATARYVEEPIKRYGLLAPSRTKAPRRYGVDNHFKSVQGTRLGPWFNAPPNDPQSCCALVAPLTEFQVQGLELDLPIVCWAEDYVWHEGRWELRPPRSVYPQQDSAQLLRNAYRVLLTRGRDGLVVFVPPELKFDPTAQALVDAGMEQLLIDITPPAAAVAT
jgi:hypothetical protein